MEESKIPGNHARIYLDWAATAIPVGNIVPDSEQKFFANPSSIHTEGRQAKEALESARLRCAAVLGVTPEKLYFTSGGTESNILVLHSLIIKKGKNCFLYSDTEHPSVRENCLMLKKFGLPTGLIAVEKDGRVSKESFTRALKKNIDARFAALMGVNNETGSINDLASLVSLARTREEERRLPIHIHADLVQALGKVPIDLGKLDSAAFSAHKLGGPRGIGLLYLKKPLESLYAGGGQERGQRPGTENTQGALAFARLLEKLAKPEIVEAESKKAAGRLSYLIGELRKIKRCSLIPVDRKDDDPRFSPWILQVRFRDVPGAVMVRALDDSGIAVSTGSACSSSSNERPVLSAMGLSESERLEGFRISQGWTTEKADFDTLLSGIEKALSCL